MAAAEEIATSRLETPARFALSGSTSSLRAKEYEISRIQV